jgi:hypothetical protein
MANDPPDVVNDFEAWAAVSTCLQGLRDDQSEQLIDQLGIADVWDTADAAWSKALAEELLDMKLDRITRYAEICARSLGARRRGNGPELHTDADSVSGERRRRRGDDDRAPTRKIRRADVHAALEEADRDGLEAATRRLRRDNES